LKKENPIVDNWKKKNLQTQRPSLKEEDPAFVVKLVGKN